MSPPSATANGAGTAFRNLRPFTGSCGVGAVASLWLTSLANSVSARDRTARSLATVLYLTRSLTNIAKLTLYPSEKKMGKGAANESFSSRTNINSDDMLLCSACLCSTTSIHTGAGCLVSRPPRRHHRHHRRRSARLARALTSVVGRGAPASRSSVAARRRRVAKWEATSASASCAARSARSSAAAAATAATTSASVARPVSSAPRPAAWASSTSAAASARAPFRARRTFPACARSAPFWYCARRTPGRWAAA